MELRDLVGGSLALSTFGVALGDVWCALGHVWRALETFGSRWDTFSAVEMLREAGLKRSF